MKFSIVPYLITSAACAAMALMLAACRNQITEVLDQQVLNDTGHSLAFVSEPISEASSSVSVEASSEYVVPSSSEESVALTEVCAEGDKLFRVWDCVDGHRVYW